MKSPDRVLHYVATRNLAVDRAPERLTSMGKIDERSDWPEVVLTNRYHRFFDAPIHALDHLETVFELIDRLDRLGPTENPSTPDHLEELDRAAGAYSLGLQAFLLEPRHVLERKGTYCRLILLLCAHLSAQPAIMRKEVVRSSLEKISRLLRSTEDSGIGEEEWALQDAMKHALSRSRWNR